MYVSFPPQCWDVIAKLRGYNNIAEREGRNVNESEQNFPKCFKVFKIVVLTRN